MNYLICGFSGAGKSYALSFLKNHPLLKDFVFIDLDDHIQVLYCKRGEDLGGYIRSNGFAHFRKIEEEELFKLIDNHSNLILSLGGGTLTESVLDRLDYKKNTLLHLDTPFSVCYERIKNDSNRPLVDLSKEELEKIYQERSLLFSGQPKVLSSLDILNFILN